MSEATDSKGREDVELRYEPASEMAEHASIPSAFEAWAVYDAGAVIAERALVERALASPMRKDYDALEHPTSWLAFDVSNWVIVAAYSRGRRVGGLVAAFDTPGVHMLEGRRDLVVLWDVRVAPEFRGRGVGTSLFRAAEAWAAARGCRGLKVETQNVNIAACRLYQRNGCALAESVADAYPGLPDEVQLIWRKHVSPPRLLRGRPFLE